MRRRTKEAKAEVALGFFVVVKMWGQGEELSALGARGCTIWNSSQYTSAHWSSFLGHTDSGISSKGIRGAHQHSDVKHRVIPFITLTDLLAFTEEALPVGRFQPVLGTLLGITSTRSLPDTPRSCIKPCSYLLQSCPMLTSIFIALITYGLCSRLKHVPKKIRLSPIPQYLWTWLCLEIGSLQM